MRSAVVINPTGVADVDDQRRTIEDALADAGWPAPDWYETTPDDSGHGQARHAVEAGADIVLVSGGDGTVMACVGALAGTGAALAVLPSGTGNLLASNLRLPDDARAGVAVATAMHRRRLDVGMVGDRAFVVMAGMGFDAEMVASTSDRLKARLGPAAYVWTAARRLLGRSMRVTIRIDGAPPRRRRARTVLVANVGRLQGGIELLRGAEPDDGVLDVAVVAPDNLVHWLRLAWAVLRRRDRVPRMEVWRATHVTVSSDRPQQRQLDGDVIAAGRTLDVRVRPGALTMCVPRTDSG